MIKRRKVMEKGKVLVIDDENIVLKSVNKILSEENYEVDVSSSGRQGIDWAIEHPYDVVLTDIRMPDIGGMRVLRDIKRAKPSLAVIMITGYASVQSAVQAMQLGAADYLEKPFTPDQLLKAVASALDITMSQPAEDQALVHKEEMLAVLERAATDGEFIAQLLYHGADALEGYDLTGPEKLAVLTGDIEWIENHAGPLTPVQRKWLEQRLGAEIW
jgi:DNA-binding NtrC family response regulator